jgi:hypothetical protein
VREEGILVDDKYNFEEVTRADDKEDFFKV